VFAGTGSDTDPNASTESGDPDSTLCGESPIVCRLPWRVGKVRMSERVLIIRHYDPRDWQAVQDIHDAARLIELTLSVGAHAFRRLSEMYAEEGLFDGTLWVAEQNARVVGFVAVNEDELTWLYVHPAHHRAGVGRRLLAHAVAAIDGEATAWVLAGNEPALRLYETAGFRLAETKAGHLSGSPNIPATGHCLRRGSR
jgi:GNAT superfamily N-acetyltransferase